VVQLSRRNLLYGAAAIAAAPLLDLPAFGATTTTTVPGEMLSFARIRPRTAKEAAALLAFDDTHNVLADGTMEFLLWPGDRAKLNALGIPYQVTDPYRGPDQLSPGRTSGLALQPGERKAYRVYADYVTDLQQLATKHPEHARMFTFPEKTLEGRTMYGIEIADDVAKARTDGRPTFWVDGVHHAREWPSSEYTMMFAFDLLSAYGKQDRITRLLKKVRVIVVPVVNPDGFVHSREASLPVYNNLAFEAAGIETGWRKNKRSFSNALYALGGTQSHLNADAHGTDPNRNYSFFWGGEAGNADPTDQTYAGSRPFAEPESRNIAGVMKSMQMTAYLTNHTSGKLCMRPWGHTFDKSPDDAFQEDLGDRMCEFHGYKNQQGRALYVTAGTSRDWSYAALRTVVYTFEHGSQFHPDYASEIPKTYAKNRGAWLLLAEAAADRRNHGVITGRVVDGSGAPVVGATIRLSKSFKTPVAADVAAKRDGTVPESITSTAKSGRDGSFAVHANPSMRPTSILFGLPKEYWTVTVGSTKRKVFLDRGTKVDLGTLRG
jgi:hypothetical protein